MTKVHSDNAFRDENDGLHNPAACSSTSVALTVSRLMSEVAELALTANSNIAEQLLPAVYSVICSAKVDPDVKNHLIGHRAIRSQRAKLSKADLVSVALALVSRLKRAERAEHKKLERILRRAGALNISTDEFERRLTELETDIIVDAQPRAVVVAVLAKHNDARAAATAARFRVVCVLPDRCEYVFTDMTDNDAAAAIIAGTISDKDFQAIFRAFLATAMRHTSAAFILDG